MHIYAHIYAHTDTHTHTCTGCRLLVLTTADLAALEQESPELVLLLARICIGYTHYALFRTHTHTHTHAMCAIALDNEACYAKGGCVFTPTHYVAVCRYLGRRTMYVANRIWESHCLPI
jgi:hypothetical protein